VDWGTCLYLEGVDLNTKGEGESSASVIPHVTEHIITVGKQDSGIENRVTRVNTEKSKGGGTQETFSSLLPGAAEGSSCKQRFFHLGEGREVLKGESSAPRIKKYLCGKKTLRRRIIKKAKIL